MSHDQPSRVSRSRSRRRSRRAEGHHSWQNEAEQADRVSVPDDPRIPADTAEVIDDAASLDAFVNVIREAGCFGYDTEFIGKDLPPESLPVATVDGRSAGRDRSDAGARHHPDLGIDRRSRGGDDRPCRRSGSRTGRTSSRSQARPHRHPGCRGVRRAAVSAEPAAARRATVGVRLGKVLMFTRWDQRPLSSVHVRYAADDVRYLHAIRHNLGHAARRTRLHQVGRGGMRIAHRSHAVQVRSPGAARASRRQPVPDRAATRTAVLAARLPRRGGSRPPISRPRCW